MKPEDASSRPLPSAVFRFRIIPGIHENIGINEDLSAHEVHLDQGT